MFLSLVYTFLVSLAVTSLYTNIPQEKGINTACRAYENFNGENTPIPTQTLKKILGLILQKNSFDSTRHTEQAEQLRANKDNSRFREYLQLSSVETEILILVEKTLTIISHCEKPAEKREKEDFIALANRHHPTTKFTAEISDGKRFGYNYSQGWQI